MVLIALPPAAAPVEPAGPTALRADANSGPQPHTPAPPRPDPTEFSAEVDHLLQQGATADTSQGLDTRATSRQPVAPMAAAPVTSGSSILLWSVVAATSMVTILFGGAIWWNSRGGNEAPLVAVGETPLQTPVTPATVEPTTLAADPAEAEEVESLTDQEAPGLTQEVQKPAIEEPPAPLPELPPLPAVDEAATHQPAPEPAKTTESSPSNADTAPTIPQLIDPLGINPADLDLLLVPKSPTAQAPPQVPLAEPEQEAVAALPSEDPLDSPAEERRFEPGTARLGPSFTEQFAPGTFEKRMAMRIPSVRWAGAPLNRMLGDLSQLAGIPIQIDPETLRMAPVTASHRISLSQQDVSLEAILAQIATDLRLEVIRVDDQLLFVKPGADVERQVTYPIDDLANGETEITGLIAWIDQFALDEPSGATLSSDGTRIDISLPARYQYEVLLFLERLRQSRGLPLRSKYPAELLTSEPRLVSLRERLSRPTTFAIVEWTPLSDVIDYWQDASKLQLLVDWRELATIDRRPLSTIAASADQIPWGAALDSCLEPLGLGWIPVDGETLQITSATVAAETRWTEFYPTARLNQLAARLQHADGLRETLAERCDADALAQATLADDTAGKQIVVSACRRVHEAILALGDGS